MIASKAVEIVWEDSHLSVHGWHFRDEQARWSKKAHSRIVTVGLLTKDAKRFYTVVQSVGQHQVNAAIKIPKSCVVSIRTLAKYAAPAKARKRK